MSDKPSAYVHSLGVPGLLGVAFVILKLCHVINWSWWWVTCPFWAGPIIFVAVIGGIIGLAALLTLLLRR